MKRQLCGDDPEDEYYYDSLLGDAIRAYKRKVILKKVLFACVVFAIIVIYYIHNAPTQNGFGQAQAQETSQQN